MSDSELHRGVVISSDSITGEVLVNIPSALGLHGSVPVDVINKRRYDGLYEVPDPGTQVVVGTEDPEFSHAFLVQVDPGTVRRSPNWDGVLTNGIISQRGTQGWCIDGVGNTEFHSGYFRGDLEVGTTVGGQPIITPADLADLQAAADAAQAAADAAAQAAADAIAQAGEGSAEAIAAQQAAAAAQAAADAAAAAAAEALTAADLYEPGTTNISGGRIRTGRIESAEFDWNGTDQFSTNGIRVDLDSGEIITPQLRLLNDPDGDDDIVVLKNPEFVGWAPPSIELVGHYRTDDTGARLEITPDAAIRFYDVADVEQGTITLDSDTIALGPRVKTTGPLTITGGSLYAHPGNVEARYVRAGGGSANHPAAEQVYTGTLDASGAALINHNLSPGAVRRIHTCQAWYRGGGGEMRPLTVPWVDGGRIRMEGGGTSARFRAVLRFTEEEDPGWP